jgi:uncharacterized protein YgiM (DUF1202 family)
MKRTDSIYFFYGAGASLLLLVGGIASYLQNGNILACLLILPVAGWFIYYTLIRVLKKNPVPVRPASSHSNIIVIIVLCALVSGSLYAISSHPDDKPVAMESLGEPQTTSRPALLPTPKTLFGTIYVDGDDPVRMRERPTTQSPVVGKAKNGELFTILKQDNEWVHIELSASRSGWIKREFMKAADQK